MMKDFRKCGGLLSGLKNVAFPDRNFMQMP